MTATDLESRCERPSFRSRPDAARAARNVGAPVLDIVVPVYNEQTALADSVHRLYAYLGDAMPFPFRITIADNASIDDTPQIAAQEVRALHEGPPEIGAQEIRIAQIGALQLGALQGGFDK